MLLATARAGFMLLALLGCSAPPLELPGDSSTTGLLLLDAYVAREVVFGIDIDDPLEGASLARIDAFDDWIGGESLDELVVFSDLPPGAYAPSKLATDSTLWNNWDPWKYYLQRHQLPVEFQSEVKPGRVTYLGRLCVEEPSGFSGLKTRYHYNYDARRERACWQQLLGRVTADSPWRPLIEARLRELESSR